MTKFVEFVPNISEGRDQSVIDEIADVVRGCDGVKLLNISSDPDHNRTVLTIVGEIDKMPDCVSQFFRVATSKIDLTQHQGIHPRIGAVDVAPFIPLGSTTMDECVQLANTVGKMIAEEFEIPVYLYAKAAASPNRVRLADIRREGFEGLAEKMKSPDWIPDLGPTPAPHPRAGATAIGARDFLVAYNIVLNTPDIITANVIARAVRESSGGLPAIQAIGLYLDARGLAQVSINLLDYHTTSIPDIQERVISEAAKLDVEIVDSELIGLTPKDALAGKTADDLKIANFHDGLILENALRDAGIENAGADTIAPKDPEPDNEGHWSILAALRFILAAIVVKAHFALVGLSDSPIYKLTDFGSLGAVMGFLLISGFSIAHSLTHEKSGVMSFYNRRFWRLAPVYWTGLLLACLPWLAFHWLKTYNDSFFFRPTIGQVIGNAVCLQGFVTPAVNTAGPYWTLSIEIAMYVLAPLLLRANKIVVGVIVALSSAIYLFGPHLFSGYFVNQIYGIPTISLAWAWVLGFAIYRTRGPWLTLTALVLGVVLLILYNQQTGPAYLSYGVAALAIGFGRGLRLPDSLRKFFNYLGDLSYPIYALHCPILIWMYASEGTDNPLEMIGIILAVCVIVHHAIEKPLREWGRKLSKKSGLVATAA